MRKIFFSLIICACIAPSFAGLRIHSSLGGTVSSLGYKFPDTLKIEINDQTMRTRFLFSTGIEIDFKEMFGATIGLSVEDRGGKLNGKWINLVEGEFEYQYRYLQVPVHAKLIVPLLIPGSIFLTAGPEFGFNIDRIWMVKFKNAADPIGTVIDDETRGFDFGISGTLGYEIPMGRYFGLSIWGGYYYGFTDIYENKTKPSEDFNLYNRAIKFGVSFISTIKEF
jgi:hypothetical protein